MSDRRAFLRGLATLPLIGGSVAILGKPTAAAVPVTDDLLRAYDIWLDLERAHLAYQQYGPGRFDQGAPIEVVWRHKQTGRIWRASGVPRGGDMADHTDPASRAAVVLAAAGHPLVREAGL